MNFPRVLPRVEDLSWGSELTFGSASPVLFKGSPMTGTKNRPQERGRLESVLTEALGGSARALIRSRMASAT